MQRLLSFRIRRWYIKLLYVVGVWATGLIWIPLDALGTPEIAVSLGTTVLSLAGILYGARIFRGIDEPDEPARPWWQMTARRTLSRVIGSLSLLVVLTYLFTFVGAALGLESAVGTVERLTLSEMIITGSSLLIVAFLYLNSAARLPKPEPRKRPPKLARPPKLT
ncbi:hypothetical protein [Microcella sp.]|uniref:hypothetical protein n=1 Tax=Microcella sp. TaxID=1913979 RepID=UPI00391BF1C9